MENHALERALLVTLILLGSCASTTDVPQAIGQLNADAHGARLEAIGQLGRSDDPRAAEALITVLDEPSANAAEREETWLEVARALERLAKKGLVGEEALPALDQLAARQLGVMSHERDDGSAVGQAPLFPYDRAAADAAQAIRLKGAERAGKEGDGHGGRTRADFLAELAWIQRVDDGERVHVTAREKLKQLGAKGVEPSAGLVGEVRPQSRGDMAAYFLELHTETGDERCVRALVTLASSHDEEAWRPALVALRDMGDARASEDLIEQLEAEGAPDTPRTRLVVSAVGGIGSEDAIPFLADLFGHESREVALSASQALTDIGPAALPALIQELDTIDRQNRLMAALALSRLNDRQGREAARRFLSTTDRFTDSTRDDDEKTIDEIERNLLR